MKRITWVAAVLSIAFSILAIPARADDGYFDRAKETAEAPPKSDQITPLPTGAPSTLTPIDPLITASPLVIASPIAIEESDSATPIPASVAENIQLTDDLVIPYYYFIQDGEDVVVYGEVVNTSSEAHRVPAIDFTFLDANGNPYLTGTSLATSNWIGPGQHLGFEYTVITSTLRVGDWAAVAISAGSVPSLPIEYYDLSALQITDTPATGPVVDGETIAGKVENTDSDALKLSSIEIEFRDSTGEFVGSCSDYVDAWVPAGQFIRFSIKMSASGICGFQYAPIEEIAQPPLTYSLILTRYSYSD